MQRVRKRALDVTWDDWNLVLDTNLRGTFFLGAGRGGASHDSPRVRAGSSTSGSVTSVFGYAGVGPCRGEPGRRASADDEPG